MKDRKTNPLKFPTGIENKLLKYVESNSQENSESVLATIDYFCWNKHWMMHIGDIKGKLIDNIIMKYSPKYVLDIGTYCGYSAMRIAKILQELKKSNSIVYSIDPNTASTSIAKRLAERASLAKKIKFMTGYSQIIIPKLRSYVTKFDVILLDHDKRRYLTDLQLLERYKLVGKDTIIIANSVGFFKVNNYLKYIKSNKFSHHIHEVHMGYTKSDKYIDSIVMSKLKQK